MQPQEPPHNIPDSEIPAGKRLVYRGLGWKPGRSALFAVLPPGRVQAGSNLRKGDLPLGFPNSHYWELVDAVPLLTNLRANHPFWQPKPEPKFIVVNGVQVPEPVREVLRRNEIFWLAFASSGKAVKQTWEAAPWQLAHLSFGLIHRTEEAAQAHVDAMLLPSRKV